MNFFRKNLFRLLVVVAGLGIADTAFAQTGDGLPRSAMDSVARRFTTPAFGVNLDGVLSSSIAPATLPQTLIGRHGYVALSNSSLGTGVTLTTSIAVIPGPAGGRITFDLYANVGAQLRCDTLTVTGQDWKGVPVTNYTFLQLTNGSPHTSSVAFSSISRIRLNNCYSGANCPGSSCTSVAPVANSQLRVYTSRFVAMPYQIRKQSDILRICRQTMPISLTVPTAEVCFPGNAFGLNVTDVAETVSTVAQRALLGTQASCTDQQAFGCVFKIHPSTNTIKMPYIGQVIASGNTGTFLNSLLDDDKLMVQIRAAK